MTSASQIRASEGAKALGTGLACAATTRGGGATAWRPLVGWEWTHMILEHSAWSEDTSDDGALPKALLAVDKGLSRIASLRHYISDLGEQWRYRGPR